ncbi:MAG: cytosol nonspecific dipeptidase, partial [Candidatus Poseidoniia archaeon]|nr:cytosol nonspecific dipeptidase [Candidatus Poseidoniia archaeon]
ELLGKEPHICAIPAGLECGVIGEKVEGMDMVSFGPTIKGPHSPDERVEISSVEKFWELLLEILQELSKK